MSLRSLEFSFLQVLGGIVLESPTVVLLLAAEMGMFTLYSLCLSFLNALVS